MAKYLISYDLIGQKDYVGISKAIMRIADGCACPLKSVWVIGHKGSATDIINALKPYIDSDDRLLVVELTGDADWTSTLDEDNKEWLSNYLSN